MTTMVEEQTAELQAELAALQALAARHKREYIRLRTIELAKLKGEEPRFTRHRLTRAELEALPDVLDADGTVLEVGQRVKCPDGVHARIVRVDKRSKRAVVDRKDGTRKMTVANRLHVITRQPPKSKASSYASVA